MCVVEWLVSFKSLHIYIYIYLYMSKLGRCHCNFPRELFIVSHNYFSIKLN